MVLCETSQRSLSSIYSIAKLRLTKLVAAAAVARSGFPLILLVVTRGRADEGVDVLTLVVVRLGVDGGIPLTVGWRFPSVGFTGE